MKFHFFVLLALMMAWIPAQPQGTLKSKTRAAQKPQKASSPTTGHTAPTQARKDQEIPSPQSALGDDFIEVSQNYSDVAKKANEILLTKKNFTRINYDERALLHPFQSFGVLENFDACPKIILSQPTTVTAIAKLNECLKAFAKENKYQIVVFSRPEHQKGCFAIIPRDLGSGEIQQCVHPTVDTLRTFGPPAVDVSGGYLLFSYEVDFKPAGTVITLKGDSHWASRPAEGTEYATAYYAVNRNREEFPAVIDNSFQHFNLDPGDAYGPTRKDYKICSSGQMELECLRALGGILKKNGVRDDFEDVIGALENKMGKAARRAPGADDDSILPRDRKREPREKSPYTTGKREKVLQMKIPGDYMDKYKGVSGFFSVGGLKGDVFFFDQGIGYASIEQYPKIKPRLEKYLANGYLKFFIPSEDIIRCDVKYQDPNIAKRFIVVMEVRQDSEFIKTHSDLMTESKKPNEIILMFADPLDFDRVSEFMSSVSVEGKAIKEDARKQRIQEEKEEADRTSF